MKPARAYTSNVVDKISLKNNAGHNFGPLIYIDENLSPRILCTFLSCPHTNVLCNIESLEHSFFEIYMRTLCITSHSLKLLTLS